MTAADTFGERCWVVRFDHDDRPADGCPRCEDIEVDRGNQIDRAIDQARLR